MDAMRDALVALLAASANPGLARARMGDVLSTHVASLSSDPEAVHRIAHRLTCERGYNPLHAAADLAPLLGVAPPPVDRPATEDRARALRERARALRAEGRTFREVGEIMGFSRERARSLAQETE